jgi:hypothetical protein
MKIKYEQWDVLNDKISTYLLQIFKFLIQLMNYKLYSHENNRKK